MARVLLYCQHCPLVAAATNQVKPTISCGPHGQSHGCRGILSGLHPMGMVGRTRDGRQFAIWSGGIIHRPLGLRPLTNTKAFHPRTIDTKVSPDVEQAPPKDDDTQNDNCRYVTSNPSSTEDCLIVY